MKNKSDIDEKSMTRIIQPRTFELSDYYETIKERINHKLQKYMNFDGLFSFNDSDRSLVFLTEELMPSFLHGRPRVMLLFSNPHPNSVRQGMFLSHNSRNQESLFWPVMKESGWMVFSEETTPQTRAAFCLEADYQGPYDLVFHCFYSFPTDYPDDIKPIFGEKFFTEQIEPIARGELNRIVNETNIKAIVVFNKMIFNKISTDQVKRSMATLNNGGTIIGVLNLVKSKIPIFLTYPTGWRYGKDYLSLRISSMKKIEAAINQIHTMR